MTQVVSNPSADGPEKIERAAKILRRSKQARDVFMLVYTGSKRKFRNIEDMKSSMPGFNINTYKAANKLAAEDILDKKTIKGKDFYYKVFFYATNSKAIIRLSKNKERLKTFPTKRKINVFQKVTLLF